MNLATPIWTKDFSIPPQKALDGDITADVAIIGGGLCGILTAYKLRERGIKAIILEANRVAGGATGYTTAKVTSQHNLIYNRHIRAWGWDRARMFAELNQAAVDEYSDIINKLKIDCDFERLSAYVYSLGDTKNLRLETKAAKGLGINAKFVTHTELPLPVTGAVEFGGQAKFDPVKFISRIIEGMEIYENTQALSVNHGEVMTLRGRVSAGSVVICTHYPFVNAPGWYFLRLHQDRSYVLALENCPKLGGMYIDESGSGLSLRSHKDYLLLGGGGHRTGENENGGSYELLRKAAGRLFPQSAEVCRWSNQDCMTPDAIPYIGQYSKNIPNMYVATGFNKWGMTGSMCSATLISGLIGGERGIPGEELFSPHRFKWGAMARPIIADGKKAVSGLGGGVFPKPRESVDALSRVQGKITRFEDDAAAAFKDENGEVFALTPRCAHMGCKLSFNPDESSWDCSCHGSRFDYKGEVLNGPAMKNLEKLNPQP